MSLYLEYRVKDEGGIDNQLESGLCSWLSRLDECDNNPRGDEESLNRAKVVELKETPWNREVI